MTDIDTLREEVTVEEVLAYYGADVSRAKGWQTWTPINCPFCSDTNGSGSMNRKSGYFLCHQCQAPERSNGKAGDIIDIVKYAEGIRDTKEACEWIDQTWRR